MLCWRRRPQYQGSVRAHLGSFTYLVVGDGPDRSRLEALTRELGLEDCVTFAGRVGSEDLAACYSLGDLFVMPNRALENGDTEGFGLVFLEANACGLPVIAGQDGGAPDAVRNGETGLIVDGNNVDQIASAIEHLLSDRELRQAMAKAGIAWARASTWEARTEQFVGILDSL